MPIASETGPVSAPGALTIWRFLDGKPGHEKQTQGLCAALARLRPVQVRDVPATRGVTVWFDWFLGRFPRGRGLPAPDLLLGAGHATHLAMLAARRAHGGRIVVLMRPSLPLALFDLCLIPEHDAPPSRANVIVTRGVLNPLVDEHRHEPGQGLFLVGGPSPHFRWSGEAVLAQIHALIDSRPGMNWTLTTSRRTPADFLDGLATRAGLTCHPATATPPGWLESEMARAEEAWCTPDSVSMVYESLTAGCRVGLFDLPPVAGSRVAAGLAGLVRGGYVSLPGAMQVSQVPPPSLDEADRCARLIVERRFQ